MLLDRVFWIGMTLKGLDGLFEAVGGLLLLFVSPERIGDFAQMLTQHELAQDPNDLIANGVLHVTNGLTVSTTLFAAAYLLAHGLVKIVLVTEVLRGKLRAYPWMIAFLIVFIGFQCYEMVRHFSWGLVVLTLFDAFIVWITWREYRLHKSGVRPSTDARERLRRRRERRTARR